MSAAIFLRDARARVRSRDRSRREDRAAGANLRRISGAPRRCHRRPDLDQAGQRLFQGLVPHPHIVRRRGRADAPASANTLVDGLKHRRDRAERGFQRHMLECLFRVREFLRKALRASRGTCPARRPERKRSTASRRRRRRRCASGCGCRHRRRIRSPDVREFAIAPGSYPAPRRREYDRCRNRACRAPSVHRSARRAPACDRSDRRNRVFRAAPSARS